VLAIGAAGCVETAAYEKAAAELDQARRTAAYKDQQIQAYQWQIAVLGQQLREAQARSEAQQRELGSRLQQLGEANAELAGKLREAEARRVPFPPAEEPPPPTGKPRPDDKARVEDLRRMIAAVDARNAQLAEAVARIERILSRSHPEAEPPRKPPPQAAPADLVDPWGFGSRK
jgi:DNA repair exonuclease SbcCD ATPase subunit